MTLTAEHRAAARDLARKSIVLLKNDASRRGPHAAAPEGPAHDRGDRPAGRRRALGARLLGRRRPAEDVVTVLDGIRRAVPGARVLHTRGAPVDTADTRGFAEAERMAREADAVVLVLGEREDMSAEAASRARSSCPASQEALARR